MADHSHADLVIMCPLAEELDALKQALRSAGASVTDLGRCDWSAEVAGGSEDVVRVLLHGPLSGMGRVKAALAASRLLEKCRPKQLWLVGIAGGLGTGVSLGDVLVGEQTIDYAVHKVEEKTTKARPSGYAAAPHLVAMARDHLKGFSGKVHIGTIASGDGVVSRRGHVQMLVPGQPKLIGVEMEGGGVGEAILGADSKVDFFHVRGVSDLANVDKNAPTTTTYRLPACESAAKFAVSFISRAFGGSSSASRQDTDESGVDELGLEQVSAPARTRRLVVEPSESDVPWLTTKRVGFPALFTLDIPDPQWTLGGLASTVKIDLSLPSIDALSRVFDVAVAELGLAEDGTFAIYQRESAWLGLGRPALIRAMREGSSRHEPVAREALHHSEEFGYFASIRDGWFVLTAQFNARMRRLHHARVEIGLPGVPLDSRPYRAFATKCGSPPAFFVTRAPSERTVIRRRCPFEPAVFVKPRRRVVEVDEQTGESWVVGLVIDNPQKELGNDDLGHGSMLVLAQLGQHHPTDMQPEQYHLRSVEMLDTANMRVIEYTCDW